MKLFGRRSKPHGAGDEWALAQGLVDGQWAIVRSKSARCDPARPVRVTVQIGLVQPDERGLPQPEEMNALAEIEETLFSELELHGAELVLVVTANRAREFVAYCASHDWLEGWGPSVISRWGRERPGTGIDAAAEPDWATYRAFAIT